MSTSEERLARARAQIEKSKELRRKTHELMDKGYSNAQIAKELGIHESSVRQVLKPRKEGK
jgi:DNA-binding NarL/FixJ family response regulator